METVTIANDEAGARLDRVLAGHIATLSRSHLKTLILRGHVTLAGRTIRDPAAAVKPGEVVTVTLPPAEPPSPKGETIPLNIVYEDDAIIVIDKPKGLVVHPAAGHASGTLVNALIAHCGASLSGIGGVKRPGIVHRLDKDTTGLIVVAKNDTAHRALSKQFAEKASGPLKRLWQVLERFLGPDGKPVASLLACTLETGRTHQIRAHLAHFGHPILGDATYGTGFRTKSSRLGPAARTALEALDRQALHAYLLAIEHPETGGVLEFHSELPGDLRRLRDALHTESREAGLTKRK
jgi:23S rRNA pseudouridine1911/1915/1917 synthase